MSEAVRSNLGPEAVAWHAVPADEVIDRLKTDPAKGLDAGAASQRLVQYGPNRLPEGKKRGPLVRFLAQLNNVLVFVLLGAGFVKLMVGLWLDAAVILGVVILNALLGFIQEGKAEKALDSIRNMLSAEARTIRSGETRLISAEDTRPRRRCAARIGRSHPCRSSPRRREEPADRRGRTDRRVCADRQDDRRRGGKGDSGRSGRHGFFRDASLVRAWDRGGRRHRERDRARTHQPADGWSERARHAAAAPDQEVRLRNHRRDRRRERDRVRLRQMGTWHGFHCHLSGGRQHRRVGHPGRVACADHRHPGDRRAAHGPAQRHHPAAPGSRDAGLGVADLLRQDGNLDLDGDDGGVGRHGRCSLQNHRPGLRTRRRGAEGRDAGRRGSGSRTDGARLHALQRCRDSPGRRSLEGRRRPDRRGPLPVWQQARSRTASRADRLSPARRDPVRIGTPLYGDIAQRRRRQAVSAGQGGARGDPRSLRSAGNHWRAGCADRP